MESLLSTFVEEHLLEIIPHRKTLWLITEIKIKDETVVKEYHMEVPVPFTHFVTPLFVFGSWH